MMISHLDIHFFFLIDTRTTQWEDPRMSNPQIAGPVRDYKYFIRIFIYSIIYIYIVKHNICSFKLKILTNLYTFQAVPYSRDYKRKYEYLKSQLRKPVCIDVLYL